MALILISILALAMFVLGSPIVLVIGSWVMLTSVFVSHFPLTNMAVGAVDNLSSYAFLAVPLFIATGDFLTAGGISDKLIRFSRSCVKILPGVTGCTTGLASGVFAAISGSNAATAATMGKLMGPTYDTIPTPKAEGAAVVAAAGCLGVIIPPSTLFIIYGVTNNVSPVELNKGGLIPGIICLFGLLIIIAIRCGKYEPAAPLRSLSLKEILSSFASAYLGIIAIGLILGGIFLGWFSPTEAAGVAALYCLLMALLVTRSLKWRNVPSLLYQSGSLMGLIGPLVVFAIQFQQIIGVMGAVDPLQEWLTLLGNSNIWFAIAIMMGVILIVGSLTESVAVILILSPIFAPIATGLGLDPVAWGVLFVFGTSIGFVTPPYGLNLFITSSVMNVSYADLVRRIFPYIFVMLSAWIGSALLIL